MIDTPRRAATLWAPMIWTSVAAAIVMIAQPAFSQGPTDAQRAAIKSQCRSDYIAHCSSVTPGGAAALQCLQKNMASLSASCQSAVRAVEASVEKTEPKAATEAKPDSAPAAATATPATEPPATAAAKPAAEPSAAPAAKTTATKTTTTPAAGATPGKPSDAQIAAIRGACRSDYPRVCAGVPTGGAPALQCLERNKSKLSAGCEQAVAAAGGGAAAPSATTAGAPAAAPAAIVLRPMRPREELFVLRSACGADVRSLCGGVAPGGGRILQCLATQAASLSPDCRGVLGRFAAQ